MRANLVSSQEEAVKVGERLISEDLVHHVGDKYPFKDGTKNFSSFSTPFSYVAVIFFCCIFSSVLLHSPYSGFLIVYILIYFRRKIALSIQV